MNVTVICVGKLKERYWREAAAEYEKRLSRYGKLETVELPDMPEPAKPSPAEEQKIRAVEGMAILRKIRPDDFVIALMIEGDEMDSVRLSRYLQSCYDAGKHVVFVIGGSLGLDPEVVRRANGQLSFSPLTFPHQMARIMLLEQIYRGCKIAAGERYHK
ncbi:MAG: 23S rRNA (pseudouridine(1915)-N(3))-methyltransferase RlmH [Clostridia bacterium]|nr:23S rRNA (pseudouridine(1915)-N(3))-methyltransferase RlmH [Clostridia bacterium]